MAATTPVPVLAQKPLLGWELAVITIALLLVGALLVALTWWKTYRKGQPNAALSLWAVIAAATVAALGLFVVPRWALLAPPGQILITEQTDLRDDGLKIAGATGAAVAGWVGIQRFESHPAGKTRSDRVG
jgi:hypothetical protein